ncbi:hypothetical protein GZH47_21055 [Paenibacillus rhizovicinus]|uniref:Uncharacterized protein n=1 Tax=Paenibacillus rhizovicinus TaxID=2704463 RepID=A0A6C0P3X8_9BACL|nr:hypothetical protein [Paenibacillus rhizovicinus]QHW33041.1 hypothetical protein GZH47_21055 [Paenibacillus rhizovicinus]
MDTYLELIGTSGHEGAELTKAVTIAAVIAGLGNDEAKTVIEIANDWHMAGGNYVEIILKTIADLEPLCFTEASQRAMKELYRVTVNRLRGRCVAG